MSYECGDCGNCSVCGFKHNHMNAAVCEMNDGFEEFLADKSADKPVGDLENKIDAALYLMHRHSSDGFFPDSELVTQLCENLSKIEDSEFFKGREFLESLLVKLNTTFNELFRIFFQLKKERMEQTLLNFVK